MPAELVLGSPSQALSPQEYVQKLINRMMIASELATHATQRAQQRAKEYYDTSVKTRLYQVGQLVYVAKKAHKPGTWSKLSPKWDGPVAIIAIQNVQAKVQLPNSEPTWVHFNRLSAPVSADDVASLDTKPKKPSKAHVRTPEPSPETTSESEEEEPKPIIQEERNASPLTSSSSSEDDQGQSDWFPDTDDSDGNEWPTPISRPKRLRQQPKRYGYDY